MSAKVCKPQTRDGTNRKPGRVRRPNTDADRKEPHPHILDPGTRGLGSSCGCPQGPPGRGPQSTPKVLKALPSLSDERKAPVLPNSPSFMVKDSPSHAAGRLWGAHEEERSRIRNRKSLRNTPPLQGGGAGNTTARAGKRGGAGHVAPPGSAHGALTGSPPTCSFNRLEK